MCASFIDVCDKQWHWCMFYFNVFPFSILFQQFYEFNMFMGLLVSMVNAMGVASSSRSEAWGCDRSVSGYRCKGFFIIYSFFLWEVTGHESCFIFLYTAICSMLDLVDLVGSYNRLPFWSWDNIPNIILHDRLILFDHSILPFFPFCCFFIVGRFFINNVT